jgi:hypothetical protein
MATTASSSTAGRPPRSHPSAGVADETFRATSELDVPL